MFIKRKNGILTFWVNLSISSVHTGQGCFQLSLAQRLEAEGNCQPGPFQNLPKPLRCPSCTLFIKQCAVFKCCLLTTFFSAGETGVPQSGEVLLQDIFAVKVKRRRAAGQESGGPVLGVALFWCRRKGRRLEEDTLHLHNASSEHTHTWYNTLKELLTGNTDIQTVMQFKQQAHKSKPGV